MTSSETSTDAGFRPWHFFVLASLVAATAAVVMSGHPRPANLILISLTMATAGLAGFACYRMVAPLALDEARPSAESLGARARATLEREKMLVLRSIKELEFDRAMGKVSESDFEDMAARLRARAIALMKQLDDTGGGYRQLIEQELRARIGRGARVEQGSSPADQVKKGFSPAGQVEQGFSPAGQVEQGFSPAGQVEPGFSPAGQVEQGFSPAACPACGTANDGDAKFCKQCGQRLPAS